MSVRLPDVLRLLPQVLLAAEYRAAVRKVVFIMFTLIIAILIIVLLAKLIGYVGAKTEEVRQRMKK